MAILPWELMIDILSRVPVKDLLRYRSVAKPWRSLIDGPDFIKLHLRHSLEKTTTTTSNSNLSVLLKSPQGLHIFDLDSLNPAAQPLGLPIDADEIEVVGCRNGLVALAGSTGDMALWNPSTRKYRKLPFSEIRDLPNTDANVKVVFTYGATGFGYDPVEDDHKMLIVAHYCLMASLSNLTRVRVYSVNGRAWKTVNGFPTQYSYHRNSGVSVGGSLNWMGFLEGEEEMGICHIVGFDLSTEEFREISKPEISPKLDGNGFYLMLSELRDCLCLVLNTNPDQYSERVEIWIMNEYGVKESWAKLFSVVPSSLTGNFTHAIAVVYLNGTDQVLVDIAGEKFVLYDVEKNRDENFRVSGLPREFQARFCERSLVGVDGFQPNAGGDEKKRTKPNRGKKREDFLSKGFKLAL